jgi:glycolate oxidase iron-sulfur subunit
MNLEWQWFSRESVTFDIDRESNPPVNISEIASSTDQCVKCGLCLPHCPTYLISQDENESPRGRLALIQGWASGALLQSPKLDAHVGNCLLCRACEKACPAYVPYGEIIDSFRSERQKLGTLPEGFVPSFARRILSQEKTQLRLAAIFNQPWLQAGLKLVRNSSRLFRYLDVWVGASQASPKQAEKPRSKGPRGSVQLFVGCTGKMVDGVTIASIQKILSHLGYGVSIPTEQQCCGALHHHAGNVQQARNMTNALNLSLDNSAPIPIVGFATGCEAFLYDLKNREESSQHSELLNIARIEDISSFLMNCFQTESVRFEASEQKVFLHHPCSLRNTLKTDKTVEKMLQKIPGLEIEVSKSVGCCGASGTHMLDHPETADKLCGTLVQEFKATGARMILTSNPGCALHIKANLLLEKGLEETPVLHPVSLIAQQMSDPW